MPDDVLKKDTSQVKLFSKQATASIDALLESLEGKVNFWLREYHNEITVVRCEHHVQSAGSTHETIVTMLVHFTCASNLSEL